MRRMTDPRSSPRRIQRQRVRGWRMPPNTVYVGRPSKFGNPYRLSDYRVARANGAAYTDYRAAREMALRDFHMWLGVTTAGEQMARLIPTLRGKNLACWCPLDQPCHADVLLELANAD